ncbi:two-component sensor histidine kinase [Streptomyces venezuelae]|uniref:histidine kinase n=1 Tax=Streptomyces venezuelae TaxID=54571 RepID=A0A5P2D9P0_STRVZ|nr:histidine kinase [Streptomyces venezuelae]QES51270.1 two-component sensor histidine kinase [Streptomyces venezuelae]
MYQILRAPLQPVTYSRWLHLCVPVLLVAIWVFIEPEAMWAPALIIAPFGLIPWVRMAEGLQAQFLLTPQDRDSEDSAISTKASQRWGDRWRTVLWLEIRLVLAFATLFPTVWLPIFTVELLTTAFGYPIRGDVSLPVVPPRWLAAVLVPVPLLLLLLTVHLLGRLITATAGRLLGPSAAERMTALELRTEQLLERTRIARELHDTIGHALTVAVVQAGAARAAGDPAFTERALTAIEETGRAALEDLERVLAVLRESGPRPSQRPTLADADRLLDSTRASGAMVDARLSGPLETLPGPVTREAYRILQEALTNVLRHSGPVPVRVRVEMTAEQLELEVVNPLPAGREAGGPGDSGSGSGSGLRGIRERAALLGGAAESGASAGSWRVCVRLPLEPIR